MKAKKGYGQFCPVAKASEIVAERWTPLILREMMCGSRRFNDIGRGVPLMSPSLLSQRLKELEWEGILERRKIKGERGFEYHLTEAGEELRPIIEGLGAWGHKFARSKLKREDYDVSLLMWDMRRRIKTDQMPGEKSVVLFEFSQVPTELRRWWMVKDGEGVDLCLKDPGHDVDLVINSDVKTMTRLWMGEIPPSAALKSGAVKLEGTTPLKRSFKDWIGVGLFADGT